MQRGGATRLALALLNEGCTKHQNNAVCQDYLWQAMRDDVPVAERQAAASSGRTYCEKAIRTIWTDISAVRPD